MDTEYPRPDSRLEPLADQAAPVGPEQQQGGDPVCWAHLVCPECGAMVSEGHRDGCEAAAPDGSAD
jgi:hypothetical protein